MPSGDAIKIRRHAIRLVDEARDAGETSITLRVGDIHDVLYMSGSSRVLDICQVLETELFKVEARVEAMSKLGPNQGMNTEYRFSIE